MIAFDEIAKVRRAKIVQAFEDKQQNLVLDAMTHRKPVQMEENRSDVTATLATRD